MKTTALRKIAAMGVILCWMSLGTAVVGQTVYLDRLLNGTAPTNSGPWMSVTFSNIFPGKVSITLESRLNSPQFISEISLNLNPHLEDVPLVITQSGGPTATKINYPTEPDSVTIQGGGTLGKGYDVSIEWSATGKNDRFDLHDVATLIVSGSEELDAADFFFGNTVNGTDAGVIVAAHIQGIPTADGSTISGVVGGFMPPSVVPEPGPLQLMWFAAGCVLILRKRLCSR